MKRNEQDYRDGGRSESGFSLVELMVVVAIAAVLAAIAVPAYVNHVYRAKQSGAFAALVNAKLEQEIFWEDANRYRYAATIGCLPSTCDQTHINCLSNCGACTLTTFLLASEQYNVFVQTATTNTFTIVAQKTMRLAGNAVTDTVRISAGQSYPSVDNPAALGFSVFTWLFQ